MGSTQVRDTHRTPDRVIIALWLMSLALNFWTSDPAFRPYRLDNAVVGAVFCGLGVWQLMFVHLGIRVRRVRAGLAVSAGACVCWGVANTQQFFHGPASLQLPIMFAGLAAWQLRLLAARTVVAS